MRLVRGNALINEIGAIRQARAAGQLSLVEAIDEGREARSGGPRPSSVTLSCAKKGRN